MPYECFDSPDWLDYPGLPDYTTWYSRLNGGYALTLAECKSAKKSLK